MKTRNNILRGLTAFLIGLGMVAQSTKALAEARHVVRIENNASQSIFKVYASNTSTREWFFDRLGNQVIIPGRSMALDLDDGSGRCLVDLKAVFEDGQTVIRHNVNICDITRWSIGDDSNRFNYVRF